MRPIQIHPLSLLSGFAVAALAFLAMSQTPQPTTPTTAPVRPPSNVVAARDMVQIKEGVPYTVPGGRLFVLTALGRSQDGGNPDAQFYVNGVEVLSAFGNTYGGAGFAGNATTMKPVPIGFTANAGSVVEVRAPVGVPTGGDERRAWGYLADQ